MAKIRSQFTCSACGYSSSKWLGSCPSCQSWNTFEEELIQKESTEIHKAKLTSVSPVDKPLKLNEITSDDAIRFASKVPELDRVLGGGFMPGSFVLLGGDPGIGKSTLTLQIAGKNPDLRILYCSGEESAAQIGQRAGRLGIKSDNIQIYTETDLGLIIEKATSLKPDLLIIDSIQTVYRTELSSMPGSVAQLRECSALLMRLSKQHKITTLAVGHMTKDGELAGPRVLEHMVDTVLMFEGDRNHTYRLLRSQKNRFGSTNEIGVFEMTEKGLIDILNPSQLFLPEYQHAISGSAVVCSLEGTRPLLLEVQSLVSESSFGTPQRMASGFDQKRLSLLLAVLEKRAGYFFGTKDVFLNIAGGIKIQETSSDLGISCALASGLTDRIITEKTVILGEVGLGAEVRAIRAIEQRVNEAVKMGFKRIVLPKANQFKPKKMNIELIEVGFVADALDAVLY